MSIHHFKSSVETMRIVAHMDKILLYFRDIGVGLDEIWEAKKAIVR